MFTYVDRITKTINSVDLTSCDCLTYSHEEYIKISAKGHDVISIMETEETKTTIQNLIKTWEQVKDCYLGIHIGG